MHTQRHFINAHLCPHLQTCVHLHTHIHTSHLHIHLLVHLCHLKAFASHWNPHSWVLPTIVSTKQTTSPNHYALILRNMNLYNLHCLHFLLSNYIKFIRDLKYKLLQIIFISCEWLQIYSFVNVQLNNFIQYKLIQLFIKRTNTDHVCAKQAML